MPFLPLEAGIAPPDIVNTSHQGGSFQHNSSSVSLYLATKMSAATTFGNMLSQQLCRAHLACTSLGLATVNHGTPSLLNSWLLMGSGGGQSLFSTVCPTVSPSDSSE